MASVALVQLLNPPVQVTVSGGLVPEGVYNNATSYTVGDSVSYLGSSYIALTSTTGNLPTNTSFWQLLASKGDTGATGATGPTGTFEDTFETVSKNLKGNPAALNYTGDRLDSIVYTLPASEEITKTLNYTGSKLTSIVLSGDTPGGILLTKTLVYTGDKLTSFTYS